MADHRLSRGVAYSVAGRASVVGQNAGAGGEAVRAGSDNRGRAKVDHGSAGMDIREVSLMTHWIKFETTTSDKPEVWAIADSLEIDPDAVVGKLLRVWAWFDEHTETGNASANDSLTLSALPKRHVSVTKALLDRRVGVSGFCEACIVAGWMTEDDNGVSLPNFDRHNGQTAKTRALTAKRVATHKTGAGKGNAKGNAASVSTSVTSALPRIEKNRTDKIFTNVNILDGFTEWYSGYPRKVSVDSAKKAYAAAIKRIGGEHQDAVADLLAASRPRFAELAKRESAYIPHPATWLNASGWTDEIEHVAPSTKPRSGPPAAGPGQNYDPNFSFGHDFNDG